MKFFKRYIGDLFIPTRLYVAGAICMLLFIAAFYYPPLLIVPRVCWYLLLALLCIDYFFLFVVMKPPKAERIMAERFSNGDDNKVTLRIQINSPFDTNIIVIDELPVQFQKRDWKISSRFKSGQEKDIYYSLRPFERGEHHFGNIILYVSSMLGLVIRRQEIVAATMVPVYPSFMQLHKYELLSATTIQAEHGSKRLRKIGHSMEFEQIKEYVRGDDVRTINWKATARKGAPMVNSFSDEKSQQVYCIIDKGRLMKMPFNNLSLLDYAINSTLVLSNVCLQKQDKVGVITFSNQVGNVLAADRKPVQKANIMQLLYNQQTDFLESDFELLYLQLRSRVKQRSILMLFTNFESMSGLKRQLPYLRSIARHHLLMVVFFENTELAQMATTPALDIEQVYARTIAEKFVYEKRLIVKELLKHGILSILTSPEKLTINSINQYLELKIRQAT